MKTLLLINIGTHTWGYIFLLIGILLKLVIGARRFNRRGLGGLQHYKSYIVGLFTSAIEYILYKFAWLIILLGVFLSIPW